MLRHEATVTHLRERVRGPVVLWVLDADAAPTALAIHHLLVSVFRPDVYGVFVTSDRVEPGVARALQRFVEQLALTAAWLVFDPQPGQVEAFSDRATVLLTRLPEGSPESIAGALADLLGRREVPCASS